MTEILIWGGIALVVIGRLALAWLAGKRLTNKEELERSPQKAETMKLHRNYCRITMLAGVLLLILALII